MIQDSNLGYNILRPIVKYATYCHYNRIVINGREKLPTDGVYIIAPCHQQALMEPMAVLYTENRPVVFMARADIFQKKTLHDILTFMKILPVYRIRDGKSNLSKNEAIFEEAKQVLLDGVPLCLMAEGRHNDRHQLLPLVKGMFRIAGETQLALDKTPLYIVPTGIDFDEYEQPYGNLVVNIGEPIEVTSFMDTYREDEPVALNQMREALASKLSNLMHDIEDKTYYTEIAAVCDIANRSIRHSFDWNNNAWYRFSARQVIAQRLDRVVKNEAPEEPDFVHLAKEFVELCKKHNISHKIVSERWKEWDLACASLAIAAIVALVATNSWALHALLFAIVCNPLPLIPTHLLMRMKIKDTQFRSSVNFGVRTVVSMLYFPICAIIIGCVHGWQWGLIALLTALAVARLNALLHTWLRLWWGNIKWTWLRLRQSHDAKRLIHLQKVMASQLS